MLKVLDLFSGIGGFSLGLERAGFETIAFCEIDPYARKVLHKHWPDTPIHKDVRKLNGNWYRNSIDVVCGGYPCQPFSAAGKRNGHEDDRHLWPEMLRIITQARPSWVIAENVNGHITLGLDQVLTDLEIEGYSARPVIIPACGVNAPHRRERIWIIANANSKTDGFKFKHEKKWNDIEREISNVANSNGSRELQQERSEQEQWNGVSDSSKDVSNTNSDRLERIALTGEDKRTSSEIVTRGSAARGIDQAWEHWAVEPDVGRVANGVPSRVDRIRCLGNAVVPQIPEIIGRAINEQIKNGREERI